MWFVTLCCLFVEICGSSPQLSPQIPQKLVSHVKTDLKSSPAEEFMPRWVKTNPKTLHVEPMGSMVCLFVCFVYFILSRSTLYKA